MVTGAEIIKANKAIYKTTEKIRKQKYQIIDRTHCEEYTVSMEEMQSISEQDKEAARHNPDILMVFIATNAFQFGMSKMWQAHVGESGFLTKIFKDRKSADAWLKEQCKKT